MITIRQTYFALAGMTLLAAPALAQPYAYVANLGSDTLSVVDTATQSVVTSIPVGDDPDGVAVTPDGTQVYVANFLSDNVSVIDAGTNRVTKTIDVGSGPVGVAVRPDGALAYVTNRGSNTVSVINVATNALVTTIAVGAGPNAVAITPNGALAYVTNSFTKAPGTVSVIDLQTNAVTVTVEVYRNPNRLAITPDGRLVYVANFRSWNVAVIDAATNTVTATVPLFGRPSGVVVNPNGASVYVATLGGTIEVIETATNSITNVIDVGSNPYGIATTHNGGAGYVANFASGTLSIVDLGEETGSATITVGDKPFAVAVNCVGSGCTEVPYTPRPTRTPTITWTPTTTRTPTATRRPTSTQTPTPVPIRVEIGTVNGLPGQPATFSASLHAAGHEVAAAQNDVAFDPSTPIAALPNGKPACSVNPSINKGATSFVFEPVGCTPGAGDCSAVRALVVALDNVDPIADGAVLYTCTLSVAADTPPGSYALAVSAASGSDPVGNALSAVAINGTVIVGTPPGATPIPTHTRPPSTATPTPTAAPTQVPTPTIDLAHAVAVQISTATGSAGQRVQFRVNLDTKGFDVSGVQNDIIFDPHTAVAARVNGKPDCTVNPAIDKSATGFAFQPPSCTLSGDCTRMRAIVLATDNNDPIPDGAVLYTCNVDITSNAAPGSYKLENIEVVASSPTGNRISSVGTDGQVVVTGASGQSLQSQSGAMAAGGGGCQTVPPERAVSVWPLLAAALIIGERRRAIRRGGYR
jgi:YVTN family beta-propeller protein